MQNNCTEFKHGSVCFIVHEAERNFDQKYVRVPYNANESDIISFMSTVWNLEPPMIILSLLTGRCNEKSWRSKKTLAAFKSGIKNAAVSTHMWIITHGLNYGVTKVIGEAYREEIELRLKYNKLIDQNKREPHFPLVLLSICSASSLLNDGVFDGSKKVSYAVMGGGNHSLMEAEPNHTHYIIVDDPVLGKKPGAMLLRTRIEQRLLLPEVSKQTGRFTQVQIDRGTGNNGHFDPSQNLLQESVPVVCMLIGGGLTTLRDVEGKIELGFPLLVCKGSGFTADAIAYAHEELNAVSNDDVVERTVVRPEILKRLLAFFPNETQDEESCEEYINIILNSVKHCVGRGSDQISIFDTRNWTTDCSRLHKELLLSLLRCQRYQRKRRSVAGRVMMSREQVKQQLQLLLDWNSPELAKTEIFDRDDVPKYAIPLHIFEQAIVRRNREQFVEIFLDRNFQIQRYFTKARMKRWLILNGENFFKNVCLERVINCQTPFEKIDSDNLKPIINQIIKKLTGIDNTFRLMEVQATLRNDEFCRLLSPDARTFTSLTLFAVLLNRHKLAKVLWKRSEYPIPLALLCSAIYRRLSHYCPEPFMKNQMAEQSEEMAQCAVGVLDLCFQNNETISPTEILDDPHREFDEYTTIQVAYSAKVMNFIAHPCCQRWITDKYHGGCRFRNITWGCITMPLFFKVLLCAILIFPSRWWIASSNEDHSNSAEPFFPEFKRQLRTVKQLWQAPITKYYLNLLAYFAYLGTLGLATLWPSCGNLFLDTFTCLWTATITAELARCTFVQYVKDGAISIKSNLIDIILQFIFIILYFSVRIVGTWNYTFGIPTSKIVLCLGVLYFSYRVPFIYMAISKTLGPELVWIEHTLTHEFADFLKLFFIVMFAGGVTLNAILYPFWPVDMSLFRRAFIRSFFALFLTEKSDLEPAAVRCLHYDMSADVCRAQCAKVGSILNIGKHEIDEPLYEYFNIDYTCPATSAAAWLFAIQYFVLVKLFLITSLFAMFSSSKAKISKKSSLIWMFKRYENVIAFERTCVLPPPLSLIYYFCKLFTLLYDTMKQGKFIKRCCAFLNKKGALGKKFGKSKRNKSETVDEKPKNSSYWRLLAQEYASNKEESATGEKDCNTIYALLSSTKDNVNSQERGLRRLGAKVNDLTEELHTLRNSLSEYMQKQNKRDNNTNTSSLCCVNHTYEDPDTLCNSSSNWNGSSIISLLCGHEVIIDRQSWMLDNSGVRRVYSLSNESLPVNPCEKTLTTGKGCLRLFGPNHEIRLIISTGHGNVSSQSTVECFCVKTSTDAEWGFPFHTVLNNSKSYQILAFIFNDFFRSDRPLTKSDILRMDDIEILKYFLSFGSSGQSSVQNCRNLNCKLLFSGYVQDCRNTDNAWIEAELWNIHYGDDSIKDHATNTSVSTAWVPLENLHITEAIKQAIKSLTD